MILFQWFSIFYTHFFFFPIIYSIRAGTIIISAYLFFFYLSTYEQAIRDADSDPESEPI